MISVLIGALVGTIVVGWLRAEDPALNPQRFAGRLRYDDSTAKHDWFQGRAILKAGNSNPMRIGIWPVPLIALPLGGLLLSAMISWAMPMGQSWNAEPGIILSTWVFFLMLVANLIMKKNRWSILIFPFCLTGYVFGRIVERSVSGEGMGVGPIVGFVACFLLFWTQWPAITQLWQTRRSTP